MNECERIEMEAVEAVARAAECMKTALNRISTLECQLRSTATHLEQAKAFIPTGCYKRDGKERVHDIIDGQVKEARSKLPCNP